VAILAACDTADKTNRPLVALASAYANTLWRTGNTPLGSGFIRRLTRRINVFSLRLGCSIFFFEHGTIFFEALFLRYFILYFSASRKALAKINGFWLNGGNSMFMKVAGKDFNSYEKKAENRSDGAGHWLCAY